MSVTVVSSFSHKDGKQYEHHRFHFFYAFSPSFTCVCCPTRHRTVHVPRALTCAEPQPRAPPRPAEGPPGAAPRAPRARACPSACPSGPEKDPRASRDCPLQTREPASQRFIRTFGFSLKTSLFSVARLLPDSRFSSVNTGQVESGRAGPRVPAGGGARPAGAQPSGPSCGRVPRGPRQVITRRGLRARCRRRGSAPRSGLRRRL